MRTNLKILLVCTSPNNVSVSRNAAKQVLTALEENDISITYADARELPPVWMTKDISSSMPAPWSDLCAKAKECDGIIFFGPVYCYAAGSPTSLITEMLGASLQFKPVMLLGAAGSLRSHLALGGMMQNLIYESNCFIMPRTALVTEDDFNSTEMSKSLETRLTEATTEFVEFVGRLKNFKKNDL